MSDLYSFARMLSTEIVVTGVTMIGTFRYCQFKQAEGKKLVYRDGLFLSGFVVCAIGLWLVYRLPFWFYGVPLPAGIEKLWHALTASVKGVKLE